VRIARLGLARHARRAKIAYALGPKTTAIPGMGDNKTAFTPGDEAHIKFLADALFEWHALAGEYKWNDEWARELWNKHIAVLEKKWLMSSPVKLPDAEQPTRQQRRKAADALREQLKPIAEQLAKADRAEMYQEWKKRWENDDRLGRHKDDFENPVVEVEGPDKRKHNRSTTTCKRETFGWHKDLRTLTDWIMGKRLDGAHGHGWKQNVGGLSLTRIATMKALYQLHKAFAMRSTPDKPKGAPEKGETNAGVAQSILYAMERMREQRVKQLASRITAAALGLGGHWKEVARRDNNRQHRLGKNGQLLTKWVWIEEPSPKYEPCQAIVIEDLTNYRPEETRTRRENRQLMSWAAGKVKKYLSEACELHGLHLREVQAGYTSRQDSRTAAPGVRCADVSVNEFLARWKRQISAANEKLEHGKGDARDRYIAKLNAYWSARSDEERKAARPLRIPVNGGEIFVSADPESPASKGLQADLNAAANIGVKALLDPDWSGKWWYIPCSIKDGKPVADKVKGAACIELDRPLCDPIDKSAKKGAGAKREIVNVWRDPASEFNGGSWQATPEYWNLVKARVVKILEGPGLPDAKIAKEKSCGKGFESAQTPW